MKNKQTLFGGILENEWEKEWVGMPEYNNVRQLEPAIIVKFKFRNQEDYDYFHKVVKEHLYNGERVFDGMQRKTEKQAWFPLKEKASKYLYE